MDQKFEFNEELAIKEIKARKAKKVLIQIPEGLKKEGSRLANYFESKTGAKIIISGESCWGGCDLALDEAKNLEVDLLIHYGHAPFVKKVDFPILFLEIKDNTNLNNLLEKSIKEIKDCKRICIASSVQHIHQLENIKKFFESKGKEVIIPKKQGHAYYNGQVIGCEYAGLKACSSNVDCFVIIGNQFHSLGAALALNKPVFLIDTYNNKVVEMSELKNRVLRQRILAIEKIKDVKKIGIIIGLKPGQKFGNYSILKKKFEDLGKEVVVISMKEVSNDKLINFYDIEGFVELACPRIAIEDHSVYEKPLITFKEALVVLGESKLEDLIENGFL